MIHANAAAYCLYCHCKADKTAIFIKIFRNRTTSTICLLFDYHEKCARQLQQLLNEKWWSPSFENPFEDKIYNDFGVITGLTNPNEMCMRFGRNSRKKHPVIPSSMAYKANVPIWQWRREDVVIRTTNIHCIYHIHILFGLPADYLWKLCSKTQIIRVDLIKNCEFNVVFFIVSIEYTKYMTLENINKTATVSCVLK